jgi:hypothetical protein
MPLRHAAVHLILAGLVLVVPLSAAFPQANQRTAQPPPTRPSQKPRISLTLTGGFGVPLSHEGITRFWRGGPAGSVTLLIRTDRGMAFGVGADAAMLKFKPDAFTASYPGVAPQTRDIGYLGLSIAWRWLPFAKYRFAPYAGLNVGASKYTGVVYYEIINGVRRTYYFFSGTPRLTIAFVGGAELNLSRWASMVLEAKMTYLQGDPNAGLGLLMGGGFRFTL